VSVNRYTIARYDGWRGVKPFADGEICWWSDLKPEIDRLTRELAEAKARAVARIAELEDQLGITRLCVMCGKSKPASDPREAPGCPPVSDEYGHLCAFDMTPQEAWAHWRQVAHEERIESDRLRAELEAKGAASVIEWEPGRSYTAAELLRRAIRGIRGRNGRSICPAVENLFGCGSRYLCRWAGRDPDTGTVARR
jgi:hypothetical protein